MNETQKVSVSCILGAFIGTLVALKAGPYLWWVGTLVGAFLGYVSCDLKQIRSAVPVAWHKARAWTPNKAYWRNFRLIFPHAVSYSLWVLVIVVPMALSIPGHGSLWAAVSFFILPVLAMAAICAGTVALDATGDGEESLAETKSLGRAGPLFVVFYWLPLLFIWSLFTALPWLVMATGRAIAATARFAWYLLRIIHSDRRLVRAFGAAIGTSIGYFAGSSFVGAASGGLAGALLYETLSVRVFKVAPFPSN